MENTPIDRLLHDYISGRISPEGMQELEAWSRESEENRQILDLIDGNSDLGSELSRMYRYDKERVWQAICEEDRRYMRRKRLFRTLRACAAVLLLVGVFVSGALLYEARERLDSNRNHLPTTVEPGTRRAVLELSSGEVVALSDTLRTELRERNMRIEIDGDRIAYRAPEAAETRKNAGPDKTDPTELFNTVRVPQGGEYTLTLSDGTRAWINAGSSITYPLHFGRERRVTVCGEVFFEVARDARHPFVVTAAGTEMTVLGTSFNVMAYDDEPRVETTLVTGSLRVEANGSQVVLTPGQQAGVEKVSGFLDVREVNVEACTMWRRGLLVFYEESLRSICRKLERWYDVRIDTSSPSLDGVLYTGMVKRHETLNTIADLMNLTNDVVFSQQDDGTIRVVRKPRPKARPAL
ncbi:FecR domain-containing protein [uncultured Alistipes sp.]|uniref:FecR family protein n=1 Tax=uncultured Alistipes sp. TaxID=538949 RepID=UPI00320A7E96